MGNPTKVQVSAELDRKLYDKLVKRAENEARSQAFIIRRALEKELAR